MKIFAISDTHFNHKKLIEYGRPFEFEEKLLISIANKHGDLLIHCGDFCIGKDEESMAVFNEASKGFKKKILVRGNHDKKPDIWYTERGFDFVCKNFSAKYFGKKIIFSHIPLKPDDYHAHNIHGHLHGDTHRLEGVLAEYYTPGYHIDLAPEIRNYGPVNIETLL